MCYLPYWNDTNNRDHDDSKTHSCVWNPPAVLQPGLRFARMSLGSKFKTLSSTVWTKLVRFCFSNIPHCISQVIRSDLWSDRQPICESLTMQISVKVKTGENIAAFIMFRAKVSLSEWNCTGKSLDWSVKICKTKKCFFFFSLPIFSIINLDAAWTKP